MCTQIYKNKLCHGVQKSQGCTSFYNSLQYVLITKKQANTDPVQQDSLQVIKVYKENI